MLIMEVINKSFNNPGESCHFQRHKTFFIDSKTLLFQVNWDCNKVKVEESGGMQRIYSCPNPNCCWRLVFLKKKPSQEKKKQL